MLLFTQDTVKKKVRKDDARYKVNAYVLKLVRGTSKLKPEDFLHSLHLTSETSIKQYGEIVNKTYNSLCSGFKLNMDLKLISNLYHTIDEIAPDRVLTQIIQLELDDIDIKIGSTMFKDEQYIYITLRNVCQDLLNALE